jgi:glutaredoxin
MARKRKIEIFSSGCPICQGAIERIRNASCPSCDITVLDMHDPETAKRASSLGILSVPAVVIEGKLAGCCSGRGVDIDTLKAEGLGQALS